MKGSKEKKEEEEDIKTKRKESKKKESNKAGDTTIQFLHASTLRSTCGGRSRDRSRRTPAWRSTSAGR